jgi:hypothetical protein
VEIAGDFQDNAAISYQLACYASELNLFEDARLWLEQALVGVGSEDLKRLALKDPALQGLWNQLKKNEDDD